MTPSKFILIKYTVTSVLYVCRAWALAWKGNKGHHCLRMDFQEKYLDRNKQISKKLHIKEIWLVQERCKDLKGTARCDLGDDINAFKICLLYYEPLFFLRLYVILCRRPQ
jgi:hypothetical protein